MERRALLLLLALCGTCVCCRTDSRTNGQAASASEAAFGNGKRKSSYTGHVYLYGESHGNEKIIEKEFDIWNEHYKKGMRHLFVELSYFTGEYLNLWMKAPDDKILEELYSDLEGTAAHNPYSLEFYRKIKSQCPETVFHGTDVGHQYGSTGYRYLKFLEEHDMKGTTWYSLAKENISQGINFYSGREDAYRENIMTSNFARELNNIGSQDVMGIYGSSHTGLESEDNSGTVPCMAKRLKTLYGASIESFDLSGLAKEIDPIRQDRISIAGKDYVAYYYGRQELNGLKDFKGREFWRVENGFDDVKDRPRSGDVLPYGNYPMIIQKGQLYVIDYTLENDKTERRYYLSLGRIWHGQDATEEVDIK
jgi:hypothetical protein